MPPLRGVLKGGSKTRNSCFPCKITLRLKKVCYKVSLCKNRQQQSCKALIGLSIRVQMMAGEVPFYAKILRTCITPLFNLFFLQCLSHST